MLYVERTLGMTMWGCLPPSPQALGADTGRFKSGARTLLVAIPGIYMGLRYCPLKERKHRWNLS